VALDSTEHDQVEAIKRFWKENGKALVGGVVIGLAILFGFQAWKQNQQQTADAASIEFMGMLDRVAQGDWTMAEQHGGRILGQYGGTSYASLAALTMAKIKMEQGDTLAARVHLKLAADKAHLPEVAELARLRLAALLLNDGEPQQALEMLNGIAGDQFSGSRNELLGDIYMAMDEHTKAAEAYQKALSAFELNGGGQLAMLQMKLAEADVN